MSSASSEAASPAARWLYGPTSDLMFGAGLLYFGFFALQAVAGAEMRELWPSSFFPLVTLLFGAPHYGATLLRVYEQRADRQRYVLFASHATIVLAGLYVAGLWNYGIGSLLITLYITWSPWHYSGQNYGVALLFFRRRGVAPDARLKRLIYASFILSFLLVFVSVHTAGSGASYAPASYQGTVFQILRLGIPRSLAAWLFPFLMLGYLGSFAAAVIGLMKRGSLRDLTPGLVVMATQGLWFALPSIALRYGLFQSIEPLRGEFRDYAFTWIALGHFLQYLWITTFYSVGSDTRSERTRYLAKALCAGSLLWVIPALVASPLLLGELPFNMGLMALTAAVINLHHFVLDGAIWKLRDGPVARALLRQSSVPVAPPTSPVPTGGGLRALWIVGSLCVAFSLFMKIDSIQAIRRDEAGNPDALAAMVERRGWLARAHPGMVLRLAKAHLDAGESELARAKAEWSLSLYPTLGAHMVLGMVDVRHGRLEEAAASFESALSFDPNRAMAHARLGEVQLRLGDTKAGWAHFKRAKQLAPEDDRVAFLLRRAKQTSAADPAR